MSAFEINIRFVGGLLSMYTLTKDKMFLKKAEEIATALLPWLAILILFASFNY